jgi:hypothetical protein
VGKQFQWQVWITIREQSILVNDPHPFYERLTISEVVTGVVRHSLIDSVSELGVRSMQGFEVPTSRCELSIVLNPHRSGVELVKLDRLITAKGAGHLIEPIMGADPAAGRQLTEAEPLERPAKSFTRRSVGFRHTVDHE